MITIKPTLLYKEQGTFAHFSSQNIEEWIDPRAKKGQLIYDIKTGNTYKLL